MKVAGIICEYNPFHYGHQYHLQKTKEEADACLCVMSGNFVQRGEPACADKFVRAEAAVRHGADLVVELPTVFACQSAEGFAEGAVRLLAACGVVDALSFGCETADRELFSLAGAYLAQEPQEYRDRLHRALQTGISFPAARSRAVSELPFAPLLEHPNDLLGVEYAKAIAKTGASLSLLPIPRIGGGHHADGIEDGICSAAFLRRHPKLLEEGSPAAAALREGGFPLPQSRFSTVMTAFLRRVPEEELRRTPDCSEGLEHRIKEAANRGRTWSEILTLAQTKRYPRTRIARIILHAYFGINSRDYRPEYLRVLAGNARGAALLKEISARCELPIITRLSTQKIPSAALETDIAAGDLYALLSRAPKRGGRDYTCSPVFL